MSFQNFTFDNNAITTIASGVSDVGEVLVVKNGTGDLFPSAVPYLLILEKIVSSAVTQREIVKVIRRDNDTFRIERSAGYCMANDTATVKTNTAFEFSADDKVSLRFLEEELADMHEELVRLGAIVINDGTIIDKGFMKLSTAPVSASDPIALSETDGRLPTQGENGAMAGTSGSPGSGNKFVTVTDPSIINNMDLSTDQTVAGVKTFSSIPITAGVPTTENQLVNKAYIDSL